MELAAQPVKWREWGLDVVRIHAKTLEQCSAAGEMRRGQRVRDAAVTSTRRALRRLFRANDVGEEAIAAIVTDLASKKPRPAAENAVYLGVVAGVAARLGRAKPSFEQFKQEYYTFWAREVLGSKSRLPGHLSNALQDFFHDFSTLDELRKEVVPSVEKALLRAPEVVLDDLLAPMVRSLPAGLDLSEVFASLLRPLLSNMKSLSASIRAGALRAFDALAFRADNEGVIGKAADEILAPLKLGKLSLDQKVLHAQALRSINGSPSMSPRLVLDLISITRKESNDQAVAVELATISKHLSFSFDRELPLDASIADAFATGISDQRVPIRRQWALQAGEVWLHLSDTQISRPTVLPFCHASLPKLREIWQDVLTNPLATMQNGLAVVGFLVTAIVLLKVRTSGNSKLLTICRTSDTLSKVLMVEPKLSFLLSPKIYTKLETENDVAKAIHALRAVAPWLRDDTVQPEAKAAWAQAFIYFIVAANSTPKSKQEAIQSLDSVLSEAPALMTPMIFDALWRWYKANELGDKDGAVAAAKTGVCELYRVLNVICRQDAPETPNAVSLYATILVLARPEIMPRVHWIELCLKGDKDPGEVVRAHLDACMEQIVSATEV